MEWCALCLRFLLGEEPIQKHFNFKDGEKVVAWAQRARRVLGPEALLMNDGYMSWGADFSRAMARELQPYGIYWFEDVLLPDQVEEQAALRPAIKPVLLAGGEHEFTHYGFAELARAGALDIWQPDLAWCGGMTAARRIVEQAARSGVQVVPHRGGEVWGLHLIAAGLCEDLAELVLTLTPLGEALGFTTAQGRHRLPELDVTEAHILQGMQGLAHIRGIGKKAQGKDPHANSKKICSRRKSTSLMRTRIE